MSRKIANAVVVIGVAVSAISSHANADGKIVGTISTGGTLEKDFPKLAKVSLIKAIKIANELVHGDVVSSGLERENGYLVYAVEITSEKNGFHEIIVDAGTGKVLADETKHGKSNHDDDDDDEEDDD